MATSTLCLQLPPLNPLDHLSGNTFLAREDAQIDSHRMSQTLLEIEMIFNSTTQKRVSQGLSLVQLSTPPRTEPPRPL